MTPATPTPPSSTPPSWPQCGHGTTPEDPAGCRGIRVSGHTACLAHLSDADRDAYLAGLSPGNNVDHRGTSFSQDLLDALLDALRDPDTGDPRLGVARFRSATFQRDVGFRSATFQKWADFGSATFQGNAGFRLATFEGDAGFGSARFEGDASFVSATFEGDASFVSATFEGDASFVSATFQSAASLGWAAFQGDVKFESATFQGDAVFGGADFRGDARFGLAAFERNARFGLARFRGIASFWLVTFHGDAWFRSAIFRGDASFVSATFQSDTDLEAATFSDHTRFDRATFFGDARFVEATFRGDTSFVSATLQSNANFLGVTFERDAKFESSIFQGDATFVSATFECDACFEQVGFERSASLGPLVCAGRVKLSGAVFGCPVTLSFATRCLECRRTRWSSTAELRLRYATVDFAHAVFEYPLTIAAEADPFVLHNGRPVAEQSLIDAPDIEVRIASLRGVDAAHLVLSDVDLSGCLFTGTVHLDQIRLEGTCSFASVPRRTHWRRWRPLRFTQRRALAEEGFWRASQPTPVPGWNAAVAGAVHAGPAQLAPVYRALRKAFEDSRNEPGAADFYYGEMEMRRHDRTGSTRTERGLLHGYWLLSGYGLRASRALGWLAAAMLVTIVLLMGFGLPKDSPKQVATGTVPPGDGKVTLEIDKADPQNPTGDRFTSERFEKALTGTLNSVVFRSSGQDLTTAGTYIEMASRVTEPVLLGLAVLAVRNRVKR
ncbi:pentapeptide repeat-containing protein [Streptomyces avermitilis]|uniref:pentapeptide repeat-containing protein n=1 Tax=Streptomyces avermitilis TaxID=33903 RepID=UPI00099D7D64|nr:pentapeptide repeat-containing protein [Streptomyces avermitilis]